MKPRLAIDPAPAVPQLRSVDSRPRDSIDALYGEHLALVKRWARRLAGPSADLEDLVHDIFLVALRKGFQQRGEATVETWLFSITRRVVWSRQRKVRIRDWLFGKHQSEIGPAEPHTPQHDLERREQSARLYRALDRLPEAYRTTLILYELEGLSGEEVARLTGAPLSTVWVRLHRGRERLAKILARGQHA